MSFSLVPALSSKASCGRLSEHAFIRYCSTFFSEGGATTGKGCAEQKQLVQCPPCPFCGPCQEVQSRTVRRRNNKGRWNVSHVLCDVIQRNITAILFPSVFGKIVQFSD